MDGWLIRDRRSGAGYSVASFHLPRQLRAHPGTVQAADPKLRGATMGLHSMCGYAGGFIGPLGVGLALDLAGKNLLLGWGFGFGQLAIISIIGLIFVRRLG